MKITNENIKNLEFIYIGDINLNFDQAKSLLSCLLEDIEELNYELDNNGQSYKKLYIDYENEHTEYSPERIDPCPDFYGMFKLRYESNPNEFVGDYMSLHDLDNNLFILIDFVRFKKL